MTCGGKGATTPLLSWVRRSRGAQRTFLWVSLYLEVNDREPPLGKICIASDAIRGGVRKVLMPGAPSI